MSVCEEEGSHVLWTHLHQRHGNALRYTAFVELMAPAFRFDFWQAVVRPTIAKSYTGWGLDVSEPPSASAPSIAAAPFLLAPPTHTCLPCYADGVALPTGISSRPHWRRGCAVHGALTHCVRPSSISNQSATPLPCRLHARWQVHEGTAGIGHNDDGESNYAAADGSPYSVRACPPTSEHACPCLCIIGTSY